MYFASLSYQHYWKKGGNSCPDTILKENAITERESKEILQEQF